MGPGHLAKNSLAVTRPKKIMNRPFLASDPAHAVPEFGPESTFIIPFNIRHCAVRHTYHEKCELGKFKHLTNHKTNDVLKYA